MKQYLISLYEKVDNGLDKLEDFFIEVDKKIDNLDTKKDEIKVILEKNKETIENDINTYIHLFYLSDKNGKKLKETHEEFLSLEKIISEERDEIVDRFKIIENNIKNLESEIENIDVFRTNEFIPKLELLEQKRMESSNTIVELEEKIAIVKEELESLINEAAANKTIVDVLQEKLKVDAKTTATDFETIVDDWLYTFLPITISFDTPDYLPEIDTIAYIKNDNTKEITYTTNKPCNLNLHRLSLTDPLFIQDETFTKTKTITPTLIEGYNNISLLKVSEKGYNNKATDIGIFAFSKVLEDITYDAIDTTIVDGTEVLNYNANSLGYYNFKQELIDFLNGNTMFDDYTIELYFNNSLINTITKEDIINYKNEHGLPGELINQNEFDILFADTTSKLNDVEYKAIMNIPAESTVTEDIINKKILMPPLEVGYEFKEIPDGSIDLLNLNIEPNISVNSYRIYYIKDDGTRMFCYDQSNNTDRQVQYSSIIKDKLINFDNFYKNETVNLEIDIYRGQNFSGETKTVQASHFISTPYINLYKVVFKNYDNRILSTQYIEKGGSAIPPEEPTKEGYVFEKWSEPFDNVTSDMQIHAIYQIDFDFGFTIKDVADGDVYEVELNEWYKITGELNVGIDTLDLNTGATDLRLDVEIYVNDETEPYFRWDSVYGMGQYDMYHEDYEGRRSSDASDGVVNENGLVSGVNTITFKATKPGTTWPVLEKSVTITLVEVGELPQPIYYPGEKFSTHYFGENLVSHLTGDHINGHTLTIGKEYEGHSGTMYDFGAAVVANYLDDRIQGLDEIIIKDGITELGSMVFSQVFEYQNSSTNSYTGISKLPDSIEIIKSAALMSNYQTHFDAPNNLRILEDSALKDNELTSVDLNYGLEVIGNSVFRNNYDLTEITIPDTVKIIKARAFYQTDVTRITIGDDVDIEDDLAFVVHNRYREFNNTDPDVTYNYIEKHNMGRDNSYFKETYDNNNKRGGTYEWVKDESNYNDYGIWEYRG